MTVSGRGCVKTRSEIFQWVRHHRNDKNWWSGGHVRGNLLGIFCDVGNSSESDNFFGVFTQPRPIAARLFSEDQG